MDFKILYYKDDKGNDPIQEFLINLGKSNRILIAKTRQGIEKLRNRAYHKEPLSKYLEPGLWELRIRTGTDILRITLPLFICNKLYYKKDFLSNGLSLIYQNRFMILL